MILNMAGGGGIPELTEIWLSPEGEPKYTIEYSEKSVEGTKTAHGSSDTYMVSVPNGVDLTKGLFFCPETATTQHVSFWITEHGILFVGYVKEGN